jgi:tRNA A-37 threonylcarbamoyl transferase component Bud32
LYDDALPERVVDALWRGDADRLLYSSTPLQVKDRCTVARHDDEAGPLLVKRHTWGGAWRTVRLAWRTSAARHCARIAQRLAEHGIPTPRPRAVVEERFGPFGYRSYLLTDYVRGIDLYRYIRYGAPAAGELRHVARQVARIWQRMVELGISHGDTKPENFIVDGKLGVWLIDFEKLRLRGKPQRQRQRQIADVKNFLHVRSWHHRGAARQAFVDAFLATPSGDWLAAALLDGRREIDADLSVLVLCEKGDAASDARPAIDSVRDIADEIRLLAPSATGRAEVIDRIEPCGTPNVAPEWVLVLHRDEAVTPFLAKELQQRIADPNAPDAFRVPIDRQFFGRTMPRRAGAAGSPVRLFHRDRCSYSLAGGALAISADPERTVELSGSIEKCVCPSVSEFIDRFNQQTTVAAVQRLRAGDRPRLLRAMIRSFAAFLTAYFWSGGIRGGWTGLQISWLEAAFLWLEESKLHALSQGFHDDPAAVGGTSPRDVLPQPAPRGASTARQSKAA